MQISAISPFRYLLSLFFFLSVISACQREAGTGSGLPIDNPTPVTIGMRGIVVDDQNQPVAGAAVKCGTATTTTDRYGIFSFAGISVPGNNAYIQVEKAGYFTGHRSFVPVSKRVHPVRVQLQPKIIVGTVDAATGGQVALTSGATVQLPANAVVNAAGTLYTGPVQVSATWINPQATNLPDIMVGDLRGITTDGTERGLMTYGMLGVELTGASGQALQLAAGKKARLQFPLPVSMQTTAPATIDCWHFDENKGYWMQEGTATRNGNYYVAEVSHFSFWNCDMPFPLVNCCMKLVYGSGSLPLVNVQVRIVRPNGSYAYGYTDSAGNLCGKVPKDELLQLQVMSPCNAAVWSQAMGPFSTDANLGTISAAIPSSAVVTLSGQVTNCSGAAVVNGAAVIFAGGTQSFAVPVVNGNFAASVLRCGTAPINYSVKAIDLGTLQESVPVSGTAVTGSANTGTLQACGTGTTSYIEYIVEGVPYTWVDIAYPNTVKMIDSVSSGSFGFKTTVHGHHVIGINAETTHFTFYRNTVPGIYPLIGNLWEIKITDPAGSNILFDQVVSANPSVTLTSIGAAGGGFIEGNFDVLCGYPGMPVPPVRVICNFRVRRP